MEVKVATSEEDRKLCFDIRHVVFVVEQNVPPDLELDQFDAEEAIHFLGRVGVEPVAASRLCVFGTIAKIQRVAILKSERGRGFGNDLMKAMIEHVKVEGLAPKIALNAQSYTLPFYTALGFEKEGDEFMEAGIPHIYMTMDV